MFPLEKIVDELTQHKESLEKQAKSSRSMFTTRRDSSTYNDKIKALEITVKNLRSSKLTDCKKLLGSYPKAFASVGFSTVHQLINKANTHVETVQQRQREREHPLTVPKMIL